LFSEELFFIISIPCIVLAYLFLKYLYVNLILIICPFLLFQKAVKQEMDLDHSYLEGEIDADGADEDYSLEHQASILRS
jgi:hypothetical protein